MKKNSKTQRGRVRAASHWCEEGSSTEFRNSCLPKVQEVQILYQSCLHFGSLLPCIS